MGQGLSEMRGVRRYHVGSKFFCEFSRQVADLAMHDVVYPNGILVILVGSQ